MKCSRCKPYRKGYNKALNDLVVAAAFAAMLLLPALLKEAQE